MKFEGKEFLSVNDAAEYLNLSRASISNLLRSGHLKAVPNLRDGRERLISFKDLEEFETLREKEEKEANNSIAKKQQDVFDYIKRYIEENSWPPTIREIQIALKISSTAVVDRILDTLENKNKITRKSGKTRAIELIERPRYGNSEFIPMLGTIAAGQPIPDRNDADAEDQMEVPSYVFKGRPVPDVFALRVKGESMIDGLIADGDIIFISPSEKVERGDIAAIWLENEGETTLKLWFPEPEKGRVKLQPMNRTMQPIYTSLDNARIKGKLVGLIRSMV